MANNDYINFELMIEAFFADHSNPTKDNWKDLISAHPEHIDAIVDVAIAHGANKSTSDVPDEAYFDKAVFDQTISKALSLAHKSPLPALAEVEYKIQNIKGPEVKNVAIAIGIGAYPSLLNGLLFGRTLVPRQLYEVLEQYFDAPIAALSEVFRRQFAISEAPAFKAIKAQPTVRTEPCSWEEAVRELKLSPAETDRLLKLGE